MKPDKASKLHFVGIGGIGMSGIAEVFHNQGFKVSGSDISDGNNVKKLKDMGVEIFVGHKGSNVLGSRVVVISSAVKDDNPEVVEARNRNIPVIPRAEMLGELMRGKVGISVAGTHGKTTTTSVLATILAECELDPTIIVGGKVDALGGNAKLGKGDFVVAEADESDGSFLFLPARCGIITNIDSDHLDHYGTIENIDQAFLNFVGKLPWFGFCLVCAEDSGVSRLARKWSKPVWTYGFSDEWNYIAKNIQLSDQGSKFEVWKRAKGEKKLNKIGEAQMSLPGRHNVLNALGAIGAAIQLQLDPAKVVAAVKQFKGVKRRFDILFKDDKKKICIVDDYGHHPTEIRATLNAARTFWKNRVIAVFQPHRFSRTLHSMKDFLSAFNNCDVVMLTDIYAAGETPIEGVSSKQLVKEMLKAKGKDQVIEYVGDLESAHKKILSDIKEGDLILCMGAGSITNLGSTLAKELKSK